ncbi:actin-like ATPase domain-containing protein [Meira miltonrushii]|uniref:Xylulose kinase n=1 Tax=Meira miltonrushii TaxID=1280837 RepID=A0A316VLE6_9BASI|nr:actin-like ATPase domain-containing protein [Meira miltonrushii]PWN38449.1 actin-like ATPase domain-containing protein [Meira miltonrushii]
MSASEPLFLGLDASTQALKASLLRSDLGVEGEAEVRFDRDLSHYGTKGGTLLGEEGSGIVYSPVMIVVEALDLLMERIKQAKWPVNRIRGISAAGQQHASVYWSKEAKDILADIKTDLPLAQQFKNAFSRNEIPNWQDSSTLKECAELQEKIGGEERLARITGSKAHARFTGPQIMRFRKTDPKAYENTWRISLVSSFMTTILCLDGEVKGIDESDACGMNIWDMSSSQRGWSQSILEIIAGQGKEGGDALAEKLGKVESDGGRVVGQVGNWFVQRYGFSPECVVCPGTGDNPATFLSFTLREREALLSLGTSDTVLVSTSNYNPDPEFHAFFHPAQIVPPSKDDPKESLSSSLKGADHPMRYFNMLVYKNGSLAREFIRDQYFESSWDLFNQAVQTRRPKNATNLPSKTGFWWLKPDIIPTNAEGVFKYETDRSKGTSELVKEFQQKDENAIAMLESQFLNYRSRSSAILNDEKSGAGNKSLARAFATGGAAANPVICEVMADVLGCDVCKPVDYDQKTKAWKNAHFNACSVAAAYKAAWSFSRHSASSSKQKWEEYDDFVKQAAESRKAKREQGSTTNTLSDQSNFKADEIVEEGIAIVARPDGQRTQAYRDSVEWWAELETKALQQSRKEAKNV